MKPKFEWNASRERALRNLAERFHHAYEIASHIGYGCTTRHVLDMATKLGITLQKSTRQRNKKHSEPIDKYDEAVMNVVKAGCTDIASVRSATGFNSYRIIEINKRLKLGIKTDKFDNQCANMLDTSFSRSY